MVFLQYIEEHWVSWVFAIIIGILTWGYKVLWNKIKDMRTENAGLKHGVRALLHNEIIRECKRLIAQGYCTPEEYEELMYSWEPYHNDLGGNGSAERAVDGVKRLPHEAPHETRRDK